jgi:hypothetical protein
VRAMNDESMEIYRGLKDDVGFYYAMGTAGLIAVGQGRHPEGLSMMEESGVRRLEMGDKWPAAAMFGFSATVALGMGHRDRARRLAERSLSLGRELGAREAVSVGLPTQELFGEGLLFSAEVGDGTNVAYYLEGLATLAAAEGNPERAVRLWGAAEAILEEIEVIAYPHASDRSFKRPAAGRRAREPRRAGVGGGVGRGAVDDDGGGRRARLGRRREACAGFHRTARDGRPGRCPQPLKAAPCV